MTSVFPRHYPEVTLPDLVGQSGIFLDGDWIESKDQDINGDVRLIQLADVGIGEYLDKSNRFMTSAKAKALKCTFLKPGDILIARMPDPIGRACIFPGNEMPCVTVVDVCIFRPDTRLVDSNWIVHRINSSGFKNAISAWVTGTTRQRISRGNLSNLKFPLPPLDEQRRIAAMLDMVDTIRRKRQESIRLTEEFIRSTFVEMFGDPVTNPKGLKTGLLGDYCDMETGYAFKSEAFQDVGIKLCRGANVLPGEIEWSDVKHWSNDAKIAERYILREGDVVLAMDRPWISSGLKVARVSNSDLPSYLVQRVARLRAIKGLSNEFIYFCIKHPSFTKHCKPKMTETTVPHISPLDIRSHQILIPDVKLIEIFSKVAKKTLETELKLQHQIHTTESLFDSLTHHAFRGEL